MALRYILEKEDPQLRKHSRAVTDFNPRLHTLLDDMRETLEHANGYGLAAPQVGVLRRVVIVLDNEKEDQPFSEQVIELINPEIVSFEGEQDGPEGCLSVPGVYGMVKRPMKVTIKAQNRNGQEFTMTREGITARCFCHETEHLEGKLFTDIASRILTDEELEEMAKKEEEEAKKAKEAKK